MKSTASKKADELVALLSAAVKSLSARQAALAYLASIKSTEVKVADVYDDDAQLRDALQVFMPGYEYPDISYLTLSQLHRRCNKMGNPELNALKSASIKRTFESNHGA
jgi:hypothetical protein